MNNDKILVPGSNISYWDGRDSNGEIYKGEFEVFFDVPVGVRAGAVLVESAAPEINNLRCNSYRIIPTYSEVSAITYNLSRDANVTIEITDPDGNYFKTVCNQSAQSAGPQELIWDGTDSNGRYIFTEGIYDVTITAEDPDDSQLNSEKTGTITAYK
jgi:hypothetical protein